MNDRVTQTTKLTANPRERMAEIPYVRAGLLVVDESPVVTPANNLTITGFSGRLTDAGAGSTNVVLKKNGAVIANLWLDSGTPYDYATIDPPVSLIGRQDTYSIAVADTPGDAVGLAGGIEHAT